MNAMKKHNIVIQSFILILVLSIVSGQDLIPYRSTVDLPQQIGKFQQPFLNPNRLLMNQSFSLSTSMGGNMSQTTGIYSNYINYKLSERMNFNTGFHLIQSQNNLSNSSGSQMGIGYELGMEYKLGSNSILSLQVINYSNAPILYRSFSPFNVP